MNSVFLYDNGITDRSLLQTFSDFIPSVQPVKSCDVLLRWGNPHGPDKNAKLIINRKQPLKNSLDNEKSFEILKTNKIRRPRFVNPGPESVYPIIAKYFDANRVNPLKDKVVHNFNEAISSGADFFVEYINLIKKYNVYIYDMEVIHLTKKIAVKTNSSNARTTWVYEELPADLDQDCEKVCHLAKRALYVLGLDLGMIHAGVDVRGRAVVLDITATPSLPSPIDQLLYKKIQTVITQRFTSTINDDNSETVINLSKVSRQPEILLGADPEFMLRDSLTGNIVYPSDFLKRDGVLGYDERSEQRQGRDFPLAEVRPNPESCPLKLTDKIHEILRMAASLLPAHIEWLAGSLQFENYQIGGHIHFSNVKLNSSLLRALDNYLGIPILLTEDPRTAARRRRQYGWIGSFRTKSHGGFEYRTPGSWLISPEITRSCLCLAKIVASEYHLLRRDYFTNPDLQKAFYQAKKLHFYDIFNELWEDITNTGLYKIYAGYLTPLTELINKGGQWNESDDIRKAWGLV